jgi:GNAT superfamily N-acetyltransferase
MRWVSRAERALFERAGLACAAAAAAGVAGHFSTWEKEGALAVMASDPALAFLSTVSGVTPSTVHAAIALSQAPAGNEVAPTIVTTVGDSGDAEAELLASGLVRSEDRSLAIKPLGRSAQPIAPGSPQISDARDLEKFVSVLLAGYEVDGPVAAFIAAEHRDLAMQRLLASEHGSPIAAAAMTVHGDVAVLGGASTVPASRNRGAQAQLIEHRLRLASRAGCAVAVATTRTGTHSEANLRRAGFRIHPRAAWTRQDRTPANGHAPSR